MQFKRVNTVSSGDAVASRSHNELALAFNQRILAGAGDAAWRIIWNAHSLMRQVRNPSLGFGLPGTQQWPAQDEWWKVYASVDNSTPCGPQDRPWGWPVEPPGEPEGANVANPMMAFVFGRDYRSPGSRDLEPEANRLTDGPSDVDDFEFTPINVATLTGNTNNDALNTWYLAKMQRGLIQKATPFLAEAPAFEAARSTYSWRYPGLAPYLKAYSSFAPVPKSEGSCPRFAGIFPIEWTAVFTPLVPGLSTLTFPTCPGVSGHLQYIARLTDRYMLFFQDRDPMVLPYSQYIEGPYSGGGSLAKEHSEILTQALNKFIIEMRGSEKQRKDSKCYRVEEHAFDFQTFLTSQYALAPASCGYIDNEGKMASYGYPTYELNFAGEGFEETKPAGTVFDLTVAHPGDNETTHFITPGSVFSAFLIRSTNLLQNTSIEFIDIKGQPIHLGVPLKPCDPPEKQQFSLEVLAGPSTTINRVVWLRNSVNPGSLRVRLKDQARFAKDGKIEVEILEQIAYIPDVFDAYAVLRCGLTKGEGFEADWTGKSISGVDIQHMSEEYFRYGCIINIYNQSQLSYHPFHVNYNAVYESARQLIFEHMRMIPRGQVNHYEVEGGKSTLRFNRYVVGNGQLNEEIQTIETEVKPSVISQVINHVADTEILPRLEYVVRKSGLDNILPVGVMNQSFGNRTEMQAKYPVDVYTEDLTTYCDDYVLYGNVKYVPPGYSTTPSYNATTTEYAHDGDKNYDHVIVGMELPSYAPELQVLAGHLLLVDGQDMQSSFLNNIQRVQQYVDGLGVVRSEIIQAGRVSWISKTHYGVATEFDMENKPTVYESEFKNMTLRRSIRRQGEQLPQASTEFRYRNGFRYVVQRRLYNTDTASWGNWVIVAAAASGDVNETNTYGFDPSTGAYYYEDKEAYGKVLNTDIQYRLMAKPVVDRNHDKMTTIRRAYFSPRQVSWTSDPTKKYEVKRRQIRFGASEELVTVSQILENPAPTAIIFIEAPYDLCPVAIAPGQTYLKGNYAAYDQLLGYEVFEVAGAVETPLDPSLVTVGAPTLVVRPDNIVPSAPATLFGRGDANILDTNSQPLSISEGVPRPETCNRLLGLKYKIYGPSSIAGNSGIAFDAPWNDGETVQNVVLYVNTVFGWDIQADSTGATPCDGDPRCVNPWVPAKTNFTNLQYIWAPFGDAPMPTSQFREQARIFQYAKYGNACTPIEVIENTAGCDQGHFTGVFPYSSDLTTTAFRNFVTTNESWHNGNNPFFPFVRHNHPSEVSADYNTRLKLTQWTPWTLKDNTNTFNGMTHPWYILRTGYEKVHVDILQAPSAGLYTIRGVGFITYKGNRYYSGETVNITADDLTYNSSDAYTKLVTQTALSCSSDVFDQFAGIAPTRNMAESDLLEGRQYRVHRGKGIKYQRKEGNLFIETTVAPASVFTWQAGDHGIQYLEGVEASQIRALEGIIPSNAVPARSESNEWCMFMTFNHYHTSNSSIWKTDSYGDVMPFLHNRCHTYSSEIRAPFHTSLVNHFSYGSSPPLVSEAPPGYTYLEDINFPYWTEREVAMNYFRSCQIYKLPYEVESARIVYDLVPGATDPDGNQLYHDNIVAIRLKKRMQHTPVAPVSISSPAAESNNQVLYKLRTEPYRTDENGLREYLTFSGSGINCVRGMLGDSSTSYNIFTLSDAPFGACHPRFYFVKLIPHVYADGNDELENSKDSLIKCDHYLQMDLYLRALCGGWLDIDSIRAVNCDQDLSASPVADYTYANLCYQACRSNGAYIDVTPEIETGAHFTPIKTIAEYDFTFPAEVVGEPVVMEYRTFDLDQCEFGPWTRTQGVLTAAEDDMPVGGQGYSSAPAISLNISLEGKFKFMPLATPIVLAANTTYYLVTNETNGGDQWRDKAPINVNGLVNVVPASHNGSWTVETGNVGQVYGPVSLRTGCVGCPNQELITPGPTAGSLRNNFTGKVGMRFTTGPEEVTVYELGRMVVSGNTGTHAVELIAGDGTTVLGSVNVNTSSAVTNPWFQPVLLPVVDGGVLTGITIANSGGGFNSAADIALYITAAVGSGATAIVTELHDWFSADHDTSFPGGIKEITITNGGSGYVPPVIVTFSDPEMAINVPAQAVARIGTFELASATVTAFGSGYTFANVLITGGGGTGATAIAELSGGTVQEVIIINPGSGYTSTPEITISGDGAGALARGHLVPSGAATGPISSIEVLNPFTNYGYLSAPTVTITGGGGTGAYAVAHTEAVSGASRRVTQVVLLQAPTGTISNVSIPFEGSAVSKTEFRFSHASDWVGTTFSEGAEYISGIVATPSTKILFNFLPDNPPSHPHKYDIFRHDIVYGDSCGVYPPVWIQVADNISGPVCEANLGRQQYTGCGEPCACLWEDPNTDNLLSVSEPLDEEDIVGSVYRIHDTSVTAENTSYYLSWPMSAGVSYNVERQMFYRFKTSNWEVIAEGVRSPYVDQGEWPTEFTRDVTAGFELSSSSIGNTTIAAVDSSSATPRNVNYTASTTNKNIYINCVVRVEEGPDAVVIDYPIEEILVPVSTPASGTWIDIRTFPQWDGRIVEFVYTLHEKISATISWRNLPNHDLLTQFHEDSELIYEIHRVYESDFRAVDEIIAVSVVGATPPNFELSQANPVNSYIWEGWDDAGKHNIDDSRNNYEFIREDFSLTYRNTEQYYVVAKWKDEVESLEVSDMQQHRPVCTDPDSAAPLQTTNRRYRVEATLNVRTRWFGSMPIALNPNRPQGFGPIPNTCTYAEMFNNFARAVNLLVYARVELPFSKKLRTILYSSVPDSFWAGDDYEDCRSMACASSGIKKNVCESSAGNIIYGPWMDIPIGVAVGAGASVTPLGAQMTNAPHCADMLPVTRKSATEFTIDPNQLAMAAVPDELKDNFNLSNLILIGTAYERTESCTMRTGLDYSCAADFCCTFSSIEGSSCLCSDKVDDDEQYWTVGCGCGCRLMERDEDGLGVSYARPVCRVVSETASKCTTYLNGMISAPPVPCGDFGWIGGLNPICTSTAGSSSVSVVGIRSLVYLSFPLY